MLSFLGKIGKGFLYILVLPVLLVVLALYAVIGLVVFLFMFLKSFFLFFAGKSLNDDLPEEAQAKKIIYGKEEQFKSSSDEAEKMANRSQFEQINPSLVRTNNDPVVMARPVIANPIPAVPPKPQFVEEPEFNQISADQFKNIETIPTQQPANQKQNIIPELVDVRPVQNIPSNNHIIQDNQSEKIERYTPNRSDLTDTSYHNFKDEEGNK